MKAISTPASSGSFYTSIKQLKIFFFCCILSSSLILPKFSEAQCGAGYSQVTLNWDYLDYFVYTGNYVSPNYLPSNALAQTQNFAFGTQRLTITHNIADANSLGENTTHTGEAGSYGTGADIEFNANGQITLTFENEVQNLKLSIYDLDGLQSTSLTAQNAGGAAQNITVSLANVASTIAIVGSGTVNPTATSLAAFQSTNSNLATINIDVAGPVKVLRIQMGGTGGDFWISDITACSAGAFPNNYYNISKPFTGQPGYVLHAFDKSVYAVDPSNGVTKLLFTDAAGPGNVNSLSYDPYNKVMYYVYSLTAGGNSRILKKYDFNTDVISTVLADINSIGIPTATSGAESGAGAFYNGALYIGIETSNGSRTSGREATIWRIDFNGANVPYRASQVFAVPVDNAGTLMHDWSDFVMTNGILYDFDGAGTTTQTDIYHLNMITGAVVNYPLPAGFTPGQPTVDWNNTIYNLYATTNAPAVLPYIAVYNGNGTIGPRINLNSTPMFSPANPSLGDAGEAFHPKSDFGDAPASYDPVGIDPATHEKIATLRLGATYDYEWNGAPSALADGDGADEDGAAPTNLNYGGTITYSVNVSVFNNTGGPATLIGWLDYNFNNKFDPGEGVSRVVPNNAATQVLPLTWNNIFVPFTANIRTFLRIRVATQGEGMTTANMNGYFSDGEVEDYPVVMGTYLANEKVSFSAEMKSKNQVDLKWTVSSAPTITEFKVERSADGTNWQQLQSVTANGSNGQQNLNYTDMDPLPANSYYRIKMVYETGSYRYSDIKNISQHEAMLVSVSPNPATKAVTVKVNSSSNSVAIVSLSDYTGKTVLSRNVKIGIGSNNIFLSDLSGIAPGFYVLSVKVGDMISNSKLLISTK